VHALLFVCCSWPLALPVVWRTIQRNRRGGGSGLLHPDMQFQEHQKINMHRNVGYTMAPQVLEKWATPAQLSWHHELRQHHGDGREVANMLWLGGAN